MSKSCFLFGHADTPQSILPMLEQAIEDEVAKGITTFYVGYRGNFDHLATTALKTVKQRHNKITLMLLLAYHPAEKNIEMPLGFDGTFYPLEGVPYKYAILRANQYMVKTVDSIICYVRHLGNARELLKFAKKQEQNRKLTITNLNTNYIFNN